MAYVHRVRVRYGETDQMGVVHHPNYLLYMEEARTSYLAELGLPYSRLEREGVGLAVRKLELRYRAAAAYEDPLTVETRLVRVGAASLTFEYRILHEEREQVLVTGSIELACIDMGKPERPPRMLPERLKAVLPEVEA